MFAEMWAQDNVKYHSNSKDIYIWDENKRVWFATNNINYVMNRLHDNVGIIWDKAITDISLEYSETENKDKEKELLKNLKTLKTQKGKLKDDNFTSKVWNKLVPLITDDNFDNIINKNKDYLPIKNGLKICLKNGEISKREREDYFSFEIPVEYKPNCDFTNVEKYVNKLFVSSSQQESLDFVEWMRNLLGYFLTGHLTHRKIYIFYGIGCNGKSKFMKLFKKILGDFYNTGAEELLIADRKGNKSKTAPELMDLKHSRLVVINELEEKEKINTKKMKNIRGDDELTGRNLFEKKYSKFYTQAKVVLLTNKKPSLNMNDQANKDSICMIPFNARFYDKQTEEEKEFTKLYDTDANVYNDFVNEFFTWVIQGSINSYNTIDKCMDEPIECQEEKEEFFEENDHLKHYLEETFDTLTLDEWMKLDKKQWITNSKFYKDFTAYCHNKDYHIEKKKLYIDLDAKFGKFIDNNDKSKCIPRIVYKTLNNTMF
jgi:P4 family phage/plasmid primase-like protien